MNNQKDTQKTGINSYGHSNVHSQNALSNRPIYEFVNKKTEKLVTALYMVTDCMETEDAMKSKLRLLGVELLSDMYKLSTSPLLEKSLLVSGSISHICEILSFVEIAYTIGYISEMNTIILKKEFAILLEELQSYETKDKHFTFTLDEKMFALPEISARQGLAEQINGRNDIKDKRTNNNNMSFTNTKPKSSFNQNSNPQNHTFSVYPPNKQVSDKKERIDRILVLIKDRDVSIKDISSAFTDCSEKTIQRELNSLVSKGQIKKTGSKRWSRYQAVSQ